MNISSCKKCGTRHSSGECPTYAKSKVDTPELRALVNRYSNACSMVQGHAVPQWRNLVNYIEGLIK